MASGNPTVEKRNLENNYGRLKYPKITGRFWPASERRTERRKRWLVRDCTRRQTSEKDRYNISFKNNDSGLGGWLSG